MKTLSSKVLILALLILVSQIMSLTATPALADPVAEEPASELTPPEPAPTVNPTDIPIPKELPKTLPPEGKAQPQTVPCPDGQVRDTNTQECVPFEDDNKPPDDPNKEPKSPLPCGILQGTPFACGPDDLKDYCSQIADPQLCKGTTPPLPKCPDGQELDKDGKTCVDKPLECPDGQEPDKEGKECVDKPVTCPDGQVKDEDGKCVTKTDNCPDGEELKDGKCVTKTDNCPDSKSKGVPPDQDGDGIPDWDGNGNGISNEYGDGPDLDGNGIPDEIGINPDNLQPGYPDQDGDGIPDGQETDEAGECTDPSGGTGGGSGDNSGSSGVTFLNTAKDTLLPVSIAKALPDTGGGWMVLGVVGTALIGGGLLLVRRFAG